MLPVKLSILICGLYERMPDDRRSDHSVIWSIENQAYEKPVELLTLYDNRKMSVGRKRSILLSVAQGEYFAFVDDDDRVAPDYVDRLLDAIDKTSRLRDLCDDCKGPLARCGKHGVVGEPPMGMVRPDVIVFGQDCHHADTGLIEHCHYGLGRPYGSVQMPGKNESDWYGLPAHTMCWRTELVQDIEFPDGDFGEDVSWVKLACQRARTQYEIPGWTGYYYQFDPEKSRTRGR